MLEGKKKAKIPRKPAVLRPKSELDCQHCVEEKRKEGKSMAKGGSGSVERAEKAGWEAEAVFNRRVFLLE